MNSALEAFKLGHGETELDVFLEPTCPYSGLTFEKLPALVAAAGENRLTVKIRLISQPWHLFSVAVIRCILAAAAAEGQEAGLKTLGKVFENREDFVCTDHCSGPNLSRSPADIFDQITSLSGVDFRAAFEQDEITDAIKWHVKYVRQNGVHVSPTFTVNGLVNNGMSSGQSIEEWLELLQLN